MKHIEEYLKDVIKIKPLGKLTTMEDKLYGMPGEMVYIDGKCSGIFISYADYVIWLEKQGEQKSVDNIKPKFKIGDWVINKQGIIDQIAMVVDNVTNHTYGYDTITGKYFNDYTEGVRLWTIKDTKPGDILATKSGRPFIFKDFSDVKHPNKPTAHCGINISNCFRVALDGHWWTNEEVYPATKKQCDILFEKMNKEGYMWDNKDKEVICIEKTNVSKEQDEYRIKIIIYFLNTAKKHYASTIELDACIDWLKSLKERIAK